MLKILLRTKEQKIFDSANMNNRFINSVPILVNSLFNNFFREAKFVLPREVKLISQFVHPLLPHPNTSLNCAYIALWHFWYCPSFHLCIDS